MKTFLPLKGRAQILPFAHTQRQAFPFHESGYKDIHWGTCVEDNDKIPPCRTVEDVACASEWQRATHLPMLLTRHQCAHWKEEAF
jgi:hypothetical protein